METWKAIEGWPYEISSLGRVRRCLPCRTSRAGKILVPGIKRRYLGVTLCDRGKQKTGMIHTLVCTAFHGPKPTPQHHAAHDDGDLTNNRAENVLWKTPEENEQDKRRHGRAVFGSRHPLAKLNESDVVAIKAMLATGKFTQRQIAKQFGVSVGKIGHIKSGLSWGHV